MIDEEMHFAWVLTDLTADTLGKELLFLYHSQCLSFRALRRFVYNTYPIVVIRIASARTLAWSFLGIFYVRKHQPIAIQ